MASLLKPKYIVKIQKRGGTTVRNVTGHVIEITLVDDEKELAYKAEVKLADTKLSDGKRLSSKVSERDTLRVYVNTGGKNNLIFRGVIWQINKVVTETNEVKFTAYDPLIYLQKSEAALYFSKNKKTKTIMASVCKSLGLKLVYNYKSVRHGKIAHRGTYADLIVDTLFEKVRKRTGKRGIFRYSPKSGKVEAQSEGFNKTVYTINVSQTGVSVEYASTMDEMVTRVKIVNDKKTKKTINGNTKKWGVLQQVQDKGKEKMSSAQKTAKQTIKDYGKPSRRWKIEAIDVPYIRKGHRVVIKGSIMSNASYYVKSITHDLHNQKMEMEVEKVPTKKKKSKANRKYTGEIPKPRIKRGSKGNKVKLLQKFLNWYGNYGLKVDGSCGAKTTSALKKFQKAKKIKVDGIYGAQTYAKAKAYKQVKK